MAGERQGRNRASSKEAEDEDEIDLSEEEEEEEEEEEFDENGKEGSGDKGGVNYDSKVIHSDGGNNERLQTDAAPASSTPTASTAKPSPYNKPKDLKARMRALKLKMNQARQLNQQEVLREGERLGSVEGAQKARQQQQQRDKRLQKEEWELRHATALQVASQAGIDGKHMVEQADASLNKARKKAEAADASEFSPRDYYNPEGQHRNYQKSLRALPLAGAPAGSIEETTGVFDPTSANMNNIDEARERDGARRLAQEMQRRIDKQVKKRDRVEFEETDVSYINLRNKRFNEKINRNFDKHTAEIRQNLERGTAL